MVVGVPVIGTDTPSTRYDVGEAGSSVSVYPVRRLPADTVWVHAMPSVNPMPTPGSPSSWAP